MWPEVIRPEPSIMNTFEGGEKFQPQWDGDEHSETREQCPCLFWVDFWSFSSSEPLIGADCRDVSLGQVWRATGTAYSEMLVEEGDSCSN